MRIKSSVQHQQPPHRLVMPLFLMLLISCATTQRDSPQPVFNEVVRVEPTKTSTHKDIEDPGKIIVTHGFGGCGQSDQPGEEALVELPGSFTLPAYANAATVFLAGWQLRYLDGDEHLRFVNVAIQDIELSGSELRWVAHGALGDENFHDGYEFCYYYTVLAWNVGLVDALVDHDNENFNGLVLGGVPYRKRRRRLGHSRPTSRTRNSQARSPWQSCLAASRLLGIGGR